MADTPIKNITSGYNVSKINDNFDNIQAKLDGPVLSSSDGQNTMYQDLDLNSNNLLNVGILNVQGLTIGGSAVTLTNLGSLSPNTVATVQLVDGAVTTPKLASSSVTDDKIVSVSGSKATFQQLGTGSVVRDIQAKLREVEVSITDFGCVDGALDNSANFQLAVNQASSLGVRLRVPAGTWRIKNIQVPSNLYLDLHPQAIINHPASPAPTDCMLFFVNGAQKVTISGGKWIGTTGNTAAAIGAADKSGNSYANDIIIRDAFFSTYGGSCLGLSGLKYVLVENCVFTKTTDQNQVTTVNQSPCIYLSDTLSPASYDQSRYVTISKCKFHDMYWSAIYMLGAFCQVVNCSFTNTMESTIFISPSGVNLMICNNEFFNTTMRNISACAIECGSSFTVISGNRISYAGTYGISVQDCRHVTITGNQIYNCQWGLGCISTSTTNYPLFIRASGNEITDSTAAGIYFLTVGANTPPAHSNFEGNHIAWTGAAQTEILYNTSTGAQFSVKHNRNSSTSSTPQTLAFTPVATGVATLGSFNFKPSHFRVVALIAGGATSMSYSECYIDGATGAMTSTGARIDGTNTGFPSNFASLQTSSAVTTLDINTPVLTYNPISHKWDLTATISTWSGATGTRVIITADP